jgi:cytochrome d ubiquinol oxidase subunit I
MMDTLVAARAQMALSLVFHIVFAAIGIGLPFLLVIAQRRYLTTGEEHYDRLARKWARAVGLLFAVGAISGTALSFELGLLWPRYMELTGAVVGHMFGLEGFAFFVEAIFLGLVLYGRERLSPRAHWGCTVVVAASGALSGILVLGVNSWMQQPDGFHLVDGRVVVHDAFVVFKQYGWFMMGLHSTLACYMAVAFAVAGVYAYGWLKGRRDAYHASAIRIAMAVGGVCALLQPLSGDRLAKFVFRTQVGKFAAMEGQFKTQRYAPLRIGGIPDEATGQTRWAIEIPGGLSFLAADNPATEVRGLESLPRQDWPDVHVPHFAFQVMVGLGTALVALSAWFWLAYWRRKQRAMDSRLLMRAVFVSASFGFIALEAGWIVTEVGRQPWVIQPNAAIGYAGMRTADAVTPAAAVTPMFFGFTVLYVVLAFVVIVLLRGLSQARDEPIAPQEGGPVRAVS